MLDCWSHPSSPTTIGVTMANEVPLLPISKAEIGPVLAMGIVIVQFEFLTHASQSPEQANEGPRYALTLDQARFVAEQILRSIATLESAGTPTGPGPRH